MSPIYESPEYVRDKLLELRRKNVCAVCGGMLNVFMDFEANKAFLACSDWPRTHHERVAKEAIQYEVNVPTRRKDMEQKYGPEKTRALAKYIGTGAITKAIATEIVNTLWGDAPPIEKAKCILICQTYQLNPLMKHLYLIGYKRKDNHGRQLTDTHGVLLFDWSIQIGIGATRLMAKRKHNYSYLDLSPR